MNVKLFKQDDEQDLMTDEQLCESRGGEVAIGKNEEAGLLGLRICLWRLNKFTTEEVLLADRDAIKKRKIPK